jgi:RNA-directed DNA polymerase
MEEVVEREKSEEGTSTSQIEQGKYRCRWDDGGTTTVYLTAHWSELRTQQLGGTYKPQPVKRVDIPKPDGGERKLGIPT